MAESSPFWHAALAGLAVTTSLAFLTWLASLVRHDVSLVDRVWGVFIAGAGMAYAVDLHALDARGAALLALAVAWALRLAVYVSWRNWGHGEDRRYREIRERNQPNFALKSLYLVFALQALLAWWVSAPLLAALAGSAASGGARPLGVLDVAGFALAAFGLIFETVADAQLARFKADPANRGRVMDRGAWRATRHPNYFGECCVWWGLWLMALGAGSTSAAWSVISPALMTFLLLKVSGVGLLEKDIAERRPAYRDYIERTSAFVPWWPRRGGTA